jgi:hypothetical protein
MSSNFPWGFPVQELIVNDGEKERAHMHILDGGVVDNTGIDTLRYIFRSFDFDERRYKAARRDRPNEEVPKPLGVEILDALRARKVLIVEIDSGAKPTEGISHGLKAGVTESLGALSNAAYSQAARAKREHFEEIARIIDGEDVEGSASGRSRGSRYVMREAFVCNEDDADTRDSGANVMTAWTLGPHDKADILTRFFSQIATWDRNRRDLVPDPKQPSATALPNQQVREERCERAQQLEQRAATKNK